MITIYGRRDSTNVQKVLWVLDEIGLAFEQVDRGGEFGGLGDPAYLEMNPNGRIPTVVDGDLVLWESNAILRHYARAHPAARLFPQDPVEAVRADMMIDWAGNELWSVLREPYRLVAFGKQSPDDPAVSAALDEVAPALARLDELLAGRAYAAGEAFSIADIPLAIAADRWRGLRPDLAPWPNLAQWLGRCRARPAFKANVYSR